MARLLSRLGSFSARHRIAVVGAWALTLLIFAAVALGGMKFSDGGFDVPGTQSSEAMTLLEEEFPSGDDARTLQLVAEAPAGEEVTDPGVAAEVSESLEAVRGLDGVASVSDPYDESMPRISEDLSTVVSTIEVAGSTADDEALTDAVQAEAHRLSDAGFTAEVGGSLADEVPEILGPTEIVGAAIAFVVLLITFGSLVAAGANMLGALVGVGVGILGVLSFSALSPIGSITPILAVMLGLAVGIDYCLFIIARYRAELRESGDVERAIAVAAGTAGSSVVFAGATVIIALTGLVVVGIPFIGEMGLAAAFAVAVAVLMSLTLLPAMLRFIGRKALPRRERRVGESVAPAPNRFLGRWARHVTTRPVTGLVAGVVALAALSLPVLSMQTTLNVPGGEDPGSTQRAAYDLVAEKFGAGSQDPLVVLVQGDDIDAAVADAGERIEDLAGTAMVVPSGTSESGEAAMLTVFSDHGPLDERTDQLVHDIREVDLSDSGAELLVTGATAMGIDSDAQLESALLMYIALIVGLALILLIILFRSILVPVIATAGFLLSLGAGLGVTTAVFQWGWFESVMPSPLGNPLLSLLPIVVTGILFGLAMDYQVFLVSRMREAFVHGASPRDAIREGFARSASVVVAAAAIMAAVFGGFALSPSSLVGSIALALMAGVIADAFVVRMILVPATLALLGRAAWWMPRWLDRILPNLDVEGENLTMEPTVDAPREKELEAIR
ncbi:MMPL family transporter [Brachybacterium paraconglomeratum]|uniref:MMPL family transporter n=1 Tax=Brachybacterium paraconglomeratum TaxID=173362 RepID=UPI0037C97656